MKKIIVEFFLFKNYYLITPRRCQVDENYFSELLVNGNIHKEERELVLLNVPAEITIFQQRNDIDNI